MENIKLAQESKVTVYNKREKRIAKLVYHVIDEVLTYIWINMTAFISLLFFKVLNRTEIIGQENIPDQSKVLLCSNHQTMIDSFLIGTFAFFPKVLIRPDLLPYHPAALENFFEGRIMSWMSAKWRCIPVKRGEKDMLALTQMIKKLKDGTMVIFPEGTRSRTGRVGPGRVGVGKLIHDSQSVVVPVAIHGMNRVLPIGSRFPHLFQKVRIVFGKPLDLDEYYRREAGKQTSRLIVDTVVSEITDLHNFLETKAYLEKAKKISHPALREKEISEFSAIPTKGKDEKFILPERPISKEQQPEEYINKEQIN